MSGPPRARAPSRTTDAKSLERRIRFTAGSTTEEGRPDKPGASGGELAPALAAPRRDDRAPGTGTHPQPEAVRLGAAAVVRLEGALAHGRTPSVATLRRRTWSRGC